MNTAKKILALAAAVAVTSMSMSVLAEAIPTGGDPVSVTDGSTKVYVGDINAPKDKTAINAENGSNVTVNGDVNAAGEGYGVNDKGSTVTVNGNVSIVSDVAENDDNKIIPDVVKTQGGTVDINGSIYGNGVDVYGVNAGALVDEGDEDDEDDDKIISTSVVEVTGDVVVEGKYSEGVFANRYSDAKIGGDVVATGEGVYGVDAYDHSNVTVEGDVWVDGKYAEGIYADRGTTVDVVNNVIAEGSESTGIEAYNGEVNVGGDVSSEGDGVRVYGTSEVVIDGLVYAKNVALTLSEMEDIESPSTIVVEYGIYGENSAIKVNTDDPEKFVVPTIVTEYMVTGENGKLIDCEDEKTRPEPAGKHFVHRYR